MRFGRRPASAASISPRSSRSSGSMNGSPRNAYASASVGNVRSSASAPVSELAVVVDLREAVLGQAPAHVARPFAQPDVVLLGAGEVDEVRPGLLRPHDHEVHLRTTAAQSHRRLVRPTTDDRLDRRQRRERLDDPLGVVGLGEEIEIADGLAPAAIRAGRRDPAHAEDVQELPRELVDDDLRVMQQHPPVAVLQARDALEDQLLRPFGEPSQGADPMGLGGRLEIVDGLDAELLVDQPDGLGPEAGQPQHLQQARRELREQLVAVLRAPGRRELGDLVGDRLPHARDLRRMPLPESPRHLHRRPPDRVRGAVVRDGLEHELALDLEQVPDVVEYLRELSVREQRDPPPGHLAAGAVTAGAVTAGAVAGKAASSPGVVRRRRSLPPPLRRRARPWTGRSRGRWYRAPRIRPRGARERAHGHGNLHIDVAGKLSSGLGHRGLGNGRSRLRCMVSSVAQGDAESTRRAWRQIRDLINLTRRSAKDRRGDHRSRGGRRRVGVRQRRAEVRQRRAGFAAHETSRRSRGRGPCAWHGGGRGRRGQAGIRSAPPRWSHWRRPPRH